MVGIDSVRIFRDLDLTDWAHLHDPTFPHHDRLIRKNLLTVHRNHVDIDERDDVAARILRRPRFFGDCPPEATSTKQHE